MPVWQAIVGATTYSLSGGSPFYRVQATGVGIGPVRRLTERGPLQDGSSDIGFRLDDRYLNLVLFFQAVSYAQADSDRDRAVEIFKPQTGIPVQIRVTRDDGAVRQIDAYAEGVLDLPDTFDRERVGTSQRLAVALRCPDPIWYAPTPRQVVIEAASGGQGGFRVPAAVPWEQVAGSAIDGTEAIAYTGNYRELPVITITGPAIGVVITNLTTGEVLDLSAGTIDAGATRVIDLRYGRKTIVDEAGANRLHELSLDSDLGTWHLAAAPEAAGGVNEVHVVAQGGSDATRVALVYYPRYIHL